MTLVWPELPSARRLRRCLGYLAVGAVACLSFASCACTTQRAAPPLVIADPELKARVAILEHNQDVLLMYIASVNGRLDGYIEGQPPNGMEGPQDQSRGPQWCRATQP